MIFKKIIAVSLLASFLSCHGALEDDIKNGNSLKGKKLVVEITEPLIKVPTMGAGDQFQLIGPYVEHLKEKGADEVVVNVSKFLIPIFEDTTDMTIQNGIKGTIDTSNHESIQLAKLYEVLGSKVPNFKRKEPIFQCPSDLILKWRKLINGKLVNEKTGQIKIPVVFFTSGAKNHGLDRFPTTKEWNKFTKNMPQFEFFNAQFKEDDIDNSIRPSTLDQYFDKKSFEDTLGLILAATILGGYVVGPDTGTAHLTGACLEGKAKNRSFLLLAKDPDQRWGKNYTKTIEIEKNGTELQKCDWYPESTLIFKQGQEHTGWSNVIKSVKNHMRRLTPLQKQEKN
jgi:hypothetical protein